MSLSEIYHHAIVPECCHRESLQSSLYSVDLNIRECGNLTVLPHRLASKLASMYLYLCQCVCPCVSVCPIYGGNLLALWTSPTCAAVETLIRATNNSNFLVGNQQRQKCGLYMVYLPVQSVTRSSWLNCALQCHAADN